MTLDYTASREEDFRLLTCGPITDCVGYNGASPSATQTLEFHVYSCQKLYHKHKMGRELLAAEEQGAKKKVKGKKWR